MEKGAHDQHNHPTKPANKLPLSNFVCFPPHPATMPGKIPSKLYIQCQHPRSHPEQDRQFLHSKTQEDLYKTAVLKIRENRRKSHSAYFLSFPAFKTVQIEILFLLIFLVFFSWEEILWKRNKKHFFDL